MHGNELRIYGAGGSSVGRHSSAAADSCQRSSLVCCRHCMLPRNAQGVSISRIPIPTHSQADVQIPEPHLDPDTISDSVLGKDVFFLRGRGETTPPFRCLKFDSQQCNHTYFFILGLQPRSGSCSNPVPHFRNKNLHWNWNQTYLACSCFLPLGDILYQVPVAVPVSGDRNGTRNRNWNWDWDRIS